MLKRLSDHQVTAQSVLLQRFPEIKSEQRAALARVCLDHDRWEMLHGLYTILAPFEFATRTLSAKNYPTLAMAYTTINILRFGLKPKQQDSQYVTLLKKSLLAQIEFYFDFKMNNAQKEIMLVSWLYC